MRVFLIGIFDNPLTILWQSPVCFMLSVTLAIVLFLANIVDIQWNTDTVC